MTEPKQIVVVGGGIAGLAAAYRLEQHRQDLTVTLVERENHLGGKIVTEHVDGFVIEGGPDSFLASKPRGIGLCRELGIEDQLVGSIPAHRRTFVVCDGELFAMPEGLSGLIPARLEPVMTSPLFSEDGKARFATEPEIPPASGDREESLEEFVERRFGHEMYSRLVEPLMAGIYAGRGDELSLQATFPQLRALERQFGSVLRGLQATPPSNGAARTGFLTPRIGMETIVRTLRATLTRTNFHLGYGATAVRRGRAGYLVDLADDTMLQADAVILATPAHVTAHVVGNLDPDLAQPLRAIPHVSTATVSLAFRSEEVDNPLDGYGYIVPRREGTPVLACTWVSSKYPSRAPMGHVLVRGFVGRRGQEEAVHRADEELVELVRDELRERLGIVAEPELRRVFRWIDGMPQYSMGHLDRLAAIQARLVEHPGLYLAGNVFRGVGVPDCIASGEAAADAASA